MAGHLPIPTRAFHRAVLKNIREIKPMKYFERYPIKGGFAQRLTQDYQMNDEHGLVDDEIVSFTPEHRKHTYEIHLDSSGKINQIYLVK